MENDSQQRRPKQECAAGQAPDDRVVDQNVQHGFLLPVRLAGQKVIGAHGEAQRQHDDSGSDNQEQLLVYAELRLIEPADEQHRQGHIENKCDRLGQHQPGNVYGKRPALWAAGCVGTEVVHDCVFSLEICRSRQDIALQRAGRHP